MSAFWWLLLFSVAVVLGNLWLLRRSSVNTDSTKSGSASTQPGAQSTTAFNQATATTLATKPHTEQSTDADTPASTDTTGSTD